MAVSPYLPHCVYPADSERGLPVCILVIEATTLLLRTELFLTRVYLKIQGFLHNNVNPWERAKAWRFRYPSK